MSIAFTLNAEPRSDLGKGASRRLRRNVSQVPAVIYGGEKPAQSISILAKDIAKLVENEAVFSHLLTLNVAGQSESVLIKALQRHPAKGHVLHADFLRVLADHALTTVVPLHFVNVDAAPGVQDQGGELQHTLNEVEISCLPKDLPEFITVDLTGLKLNEHLHLADLKLPAGVQLVALQHDNNLQVAAIHLPRVQAADDAAEDEAPSAAADESPAE